jgi:hypothetical protein
MCILRERYNKIIVTRWFDEYWSENYNEGVVAELASLSSLSTEDLAEPQLDLAI